MQRIRSVLLLILLLAVPRLMFAQGVTTASIGGTVTDTQNQPIPGATVIVLHTPSGTKYGSSTQLDGRYFIRGLRVGGPYVITVSDVGYKTQEVRNVDLEIGQNLELNFKLSEQAVNVGGVEVVAENHGLMNTNRTGAATTVSKTFINSFPTITRSFQDFESLSPEFVGNSALGRNNKYNNIQIDGANYNDLFGLPSNGTPGGQAGTTPISLDAIQEFQVTLAPFDVRQGGFTGGEVNAITRSGTNQYTGSVYFFGQNQNFIGTSPDAFKKAYPNFSNVQTGFRVGGPIMKDKLFFFVNGEITRQRQPLYDVMNPSDSATQKFASILQSYGYNPGTTNTYTLLTPSNKLFARIDYNINETNKLTVRDNYVDANQDNLTRTSSTLYYSSSVYTFNDKTNSLLAQLNSTINNNLSNELILGYTTIRDTRVVPSPVFPMVQVKDPSLPNGGVLVAGTEEFSGANALNQDIWELTDNLSWVLGDHLLTFGTHDESFTFSNLFIRDYYGWYSFNSLSDFAAGKVNEYRYSYSNLPGVSEPKANWSAVQYGFYAQDEWSAMPNLKLTYGIRADIPTFPDKPLDNPTFDATFAFMGLKTSQTPKTAVLFSPRLGINWDLSGDRSTVLRGGAGVFTGRVPYVWLSNQYSNTGVDILRVDTYGLPAGFFTANPLAQPVPGGSLPVDTLLSPIKTTEIDLTANNFKMPQVFRVDLAVDHQLPFGIVGTVEGIYSQSMNDVLYQDINIKPTGQTLAFDGRPLYGTPVAGKNYWTVNKISNAYTNVVYMANTSKPYEYDITGSLERQFNQGLFELLNVHGIRDLLFADLSYTYSGSYDQNAVTSSQAISQWRYNPVPGDPNNPPLAVSDFSVPSRVVASVSERVDYAHGFATTLSLFYTGRSGSPFSYIYYGDVNGDGQNQNDLVYVPKNVVPGGDINLVTYNSTSKAYAPASASAYTQLADYINADPYLSKYKGQIVPRNGGRSPWQGTLNLRLAQDIPTVDGQSIEFTVDVLNVLNLLNHSWGYIQTVPYGTYTLLNYEGMNAQNQPTFALSLPKTGEPWSADPFYSRWQLQLGARYNF
jgi:Carboxypeptidase regulatory-like domain